MAAVVFLNDIWEQMFHMYSSFFQKITKGFQQK